jgi:hypothetical protein
LASLHLEERIEKLLHGFTIPGFGPVNDRAEGLHGCGGTLETFPHYVRDSAIEECGDLLIGLVGISVETEIHALV